VLFWRNRHQVDEAALNAFVDGELDAVEAARVTLHAGACAACRETIAELRALSGAMKSLAVERAPRSFVLREADVTSAPAAESTPRGGLLAGATPLLGGVAMVAFLVFFVLVGVDVTGERSSDEASFAGELVPQSSETARDADSGALSDDGALEADAALPADNEAPVRAPDGQATGDGEAEAMFPLAAVGEGPDVGGGDLEADDDPAAVDGMPPDETLAIGNTVAFDQSDDDSSRLRLAQTASAAVALVAGGSATVLWWRRRSAERS